MATHLTQDVRPKLRYAPLDQNVAIPIASTKDMHPDDFNVGANNYEVSALFNLSNLAIIWANHLCYKFGAACRDIAVKHVEAVWHGPVWWTLQLRAGVCCENDDTK